MIKVTEEINLDDFKWWGGAQDTFDMVYNCRKLIELENLIKDHFGSDHVDKTELNDFLWFEEDRIFNALGIQTEEEDDEEEDDEEDDEEY